LACHGPTVRNSRSPAPDKGQLSQLVQLLGGDASAVAGTAHDRPITLWRVREGGSLLREGAEATTLFVLRSGSLKCVKTLADGYEQVFSLALPGELLGFESLHARRHATSLVALEDTTAYALPVCELQRLRRDSPELDMALQDALSRQLVRAGETAELMAAVVSSVRLARFLLWLSQRMASMGRSPRRLLLRMGRRDIASLLAVAHETVSRSFTALSDAGLITVNNREVDILDHDRLVAFARSTRGLQDEPGARHGGLNSAGRPEITNRSSVRRLQALTGIHRGCTRTCSSTAMLSTPAK
jgi:CRP/FNR family transcriptional regulator